MAQIKRFASAIVNSSAFENFVALLENAGAERPDYLRVLTYHRVNEPSAQPWVNPGLISATPDAFEAQMDYLAANYQPVSASQVATAYEMGRQNALPARSVMVTFDDAYLDFEKHAWPVLKHFRIPAILFVPTAFPDHPERVFWWDRIYDALQTSVVGEVKTPVGNLPLSKPAQRDQAYRSLRNYIKTLPHTSGMAVVEEICTALGVIPHPNDVLTWTSLRKLAGEGVTLGAHTQNHPIMNHITPEELQNEIVGSLNDLKQQIGFESHTFAYPSGIHNDDVVKAVERAGFKLAFTTGRGINHLGQTPRLRLQRINVGSRTTLPVLRAQLLSWSIPLYTLSNKFFS